jgi:hypothetical protein
VVHLRARFVFCPAFSAHPTLISRFWATSFLLRCTVYVTSVAPTADDQNLFVTMSFRNIGGTLTSLPLQYTDGDVDIISLSDSSFSASTAGVLSSETLSWMQLNYHVTPQNGQLMFSKPLFLGTGRAQGDFIIGYSGTQYYPKSTFVPLPFAFLTKDAHVHSYLMVYSGLVCSDTGAACLGMYERECVCMV